MTKLPYEIDGPYTAGQEEPADGRFVAAMRLVYYVVRLAAWASVIGLCWSLIGKLSTGCA